VAFQMLCCAGYLLERSLNIDPHQPVVLQKWGKVIDSLTFLDPSDRQKTAMVDLYLDVYKRLVVNFVKEKETGEISLKPLIALALSENDNETQNRAVEVCYHVCVCKHMCVYV
jgi:hypothetical protein